MALNMETNYCGFRCENPFILASSPVSATGEMICRAFEEGCDFSIRRWKDLTVCLWDLI